MWASRIALITGPRQIGKSVLCGRLIEKLRADGVQLAGFTTQHTGEHDMQVTELASGVQYPLTLPFESEGGWRLGRFRMDPAAFARSLQALESAFPTQVIVLDEIGPLELQQQQGWVQVFELLRRVDYSLAFVVIRPELLAGALKALDVETCTVTFVTEQNRDHLVETLTILAQEACRAWRATANTDGSSG